MRIPVHIIKCGLLLIVAALAACSTSGSNFNSGTLPLLVPGETTLADASALLEAYPLTTYQDRAGAVDAYWSYRNSALDHLLWHKSALLRFGPDGKFERVVHTTGILRPAASDSQR